MTKKDVLIVSNTIDVYQPLQKLLQNQELEVRVLTVVPETFEAYVGSSHILSIVDASLEKVNMISILQSIHNEKKTPILVLYDGSRPLDRLALFQAGATVCMEQSIDPREQLAQAKALIELYCAANDKEKLGFRSGLMIIPAYRLVMLNGEPLKLTRREYDLLRYLAEHSQQVMTREEIFRQVWGRDLNYCGDDAIKSCIRNLRRKLRPSGREFIKTEWGVGYCFVGND